MGWRRTDIFARTIYPGNNIVAYENSVTDFRARVYREGAGTNRASYVNFYWVTPSLWVGSRSTWAFATTGSVAKHCPAPWPRNSAFGSLVPGITFSGYDAPFHWNDISPRVGVTYALDSENKSILRASFSRNAGQLTSVNTYIGYANPSSAAGWAEYPWTDANGDHLAQTNEVTITPQPLASGGGFNTANPTAVASANRIDPDFNAPKTTGVIIGFDRELMPNLALQVNYTYGRVDQSPEGEQYAVHRSDHRGLAADGAAGRDDAGRRGLQHSSVHPGRRKGCGGRRRAFPHQLRGLLDEVQWRGIRREQANVQSLDGAAGVCV